MSTFEDCWVTKTFLNVLKDKKKGNRLSKIRNLGWILVCLGKKEKKIL